MEKINRHMVYDTLKKWYDDEFCSPTRDSLSSHLCKHFSFTKLKEWGDSVKHKSHNHDKNALRLFVQRHFGRSIPLSDWVDARLRQYMPDALAGGPLLKRSKRILAVFHYLLELDECPPFQNAQELIAAGMAPMLLFRSICPGGSIEQYIRVVCTQNAFLLESSSHASHASHPTHPTHDVPLPLPTRADMVILKLRIHDLMKINEEMRAELNEAKGVILKHEQEMTQLKRELEEVREKLHVELSQMNPRLDSIFSLLNDRMSDF